METLNFADNWRLFHPVDKEYTFYSSPYTVFTRKDYIFGTDNTIPTISGAEIHDIAISYHAPIPIWLADPSAQHNLHLWRFPSFLYKNTDFQASMGAAWEEFLSANSVHMDNPNLLWDAGKAFIRGWSISFFKKHALANYLKHAKANLGGTLPSSLWMQRKLFDNVNFDCLSLVLAKMGFTGPFNHLIKPMYASLMDRLVVACLLTEGFRLHKGTRHGAPSHHYYSI